MSVTGSIYVKELRTVWVALSRVTEGWSDEECAALIAGDDDAREAAVRAALDFAAAEGDSEIEVCQIHTSEGRASDA